MLSVTGAKFINWNLGAGGGGAIDLVNTANRTTSTPMSSLLPVLLCGGLTIGGFSIALIALTIRIIDPAPIWSVQGSEHSRCSMHTVLRPFFHFRMSFNRSSCNALPAAEQARCLSRDESWGQHSTWLMLRPVRPSWVIAIAMPHVYFSTPCG